MRYHQILRPRWKGLYAARKRQKNAASKLPPLPDTFLGWIPVLYRISEEQVLASAGLDAYVVRESYKHSTREADVLMNATVPVVL